MKSDAQIQAETARAWLKRALECYRVGDRARGRSYADEALEHAALVRDGGELVRKVQATLDAAEKRAPRRSRYKRA